MMTDPIGDLLTRLRNAQSRGLNKITSPASKLRATVLDVLTNEGYIRGYLEIEKDGHKELEIELKYYDGRPVIKEISRVSTPGRRVYSGIKGLPRPYGGLGVTIVSTPQGVMSDNAARDKNVGGEVLAHVF